MAGGLHGAALAGSSRLTAAVDRGGETGGLSQELAHLQVPPSLATLAARSDKCLSFPVPPPPPPFGLPPYSPSNLALLTVSLLVQRKSSCLCNAIHQYLARSLDCVSFSASLSALTVLSSPPTVPYSPLARSVHTQTSRLFPLSFHSSTAFSLFVLIAASPPATQADPANASLG
jgi:hypothetical protein